MFSYRCCVYKISDHKSKIWALHGLISSQVRNYTKFKYKLKKTYNFWTTGSYALKWLLIVSWVQYLSYLKRSGRNSNNWVRYGEVTSQAKYTEIKCDQQSVPTFLIFMENDNTFRSHRQKEFEIFDETRLNSVFAQDVWRQSRIPFCQQVKVCSWNLMRQGAEKRMRWLQICLLLVLVPSCSWDMFGQWIACH